MNIVDARLIRCKEHGQQFYTWAGRKRVCKVCHDEKVEAKARKVPLRPDSGDDLASVVAA